MGSKYRDEGSSVIKFSVLGSGSCGNSYVFSCGEHTLMVDAGYSLRKLETRMLEAGFELSRVEALLLTHLHPDHNGSAGAFARKLGKPVYVSTKAQQFAKVEYEKMALPPASKRSFEPGEGFEIGPFFIDAFYSSHDSAGSVGFAISCEGKKIVLITDTGIYSEEMLLHAKNADLLFLESNYDVEMLRTGPYPLYLKKRIAGERGHLSNDQAREFLTLCGYEETQKPVYLIHVSDSNNAVERVASAMSCFNAKVCQRGCQYSGQLG